MFFVMLFLFLMHNNVCFLCFDILVSLFLLFFINLPKYICHQKRQVKIFAYDIDLLNAVFF